MPGNNNNGNGIAGTDGINGDRIESKTFLMMAMMKIMIIWKALQIKL